MSNSRARKPGGGRKPSKPAPSKKLTPLSNNLIMVDRKKLKNPNGLILGTPGSGKSFSAKREIANAFLVTDDDIIINDPEGEYSPLVNRLKGQVIKISPNSTQFVNPMDINANYSEEDNPLSLKRRCPRPCCFYRSRRSAVQRNCGNVQRRQPNAIMSWAIPSRQRKHG